MEINTFKLIPFQNLKISIQKHFKIYCEERIGNGGFSICHSLQIQTGYLFGR